MSGVGLRVCEARRPVSEARPLTAATFLGMSASVGAAKRSAGCGRHCAKDSSSIFSSCSRLPLQLQMR